MSFVLVNWNTRDLTLRCLQALSAQSSVLGAEIILVDNGSTDGSADAIATKFPSIRLIRNQNNLGFARAANQGIRASGAPIVAILNTDILVGGAELAKVLQVAENTRDLGALGCALLKGDGEPWTYDNRFPTPIRIGFCEQLPISLIRPRMRYRKVAENLAEVDWLAGACLFMPRAALENTGLFDERFFLYKEDVDLCLRLYQSGYRILFFDGVQLKHLVAQSTRRNPGRMADRARIEAFKSSVTYARKHASATAVTLIVLALRIVLLARIAKNLLLEFPHGRKRARDKLAWLSEAFRTLNTPPKGSDGNLEWNSTDSVV